MVPMAVPGVAAPAAGGNALAMLASRLEAVRQQVDTLSAQADAAVGSAQLPPASPAVAVPAPVQTQAMTQMGADIKKLLQRVQALEDDNAKLHEQVSAQNTQLAKVQTSQQADEKELGSVKA